MGAFEDAKQVEARSLKILLPLLEAKAENGHLVLTDKGRLSKELQKRYGDIFLNGKGGGLQAIEIKAEESDLYDNFFLETWSNRSRLTVGWMITLRCDWLLYHFLEQDDLYFIDFPALQHWAFRENNIYAYQEKPQNKYKQMNDTWGRCVPHKIVRAAVATYLIHPATWREPQGIHTPAQAQQNTLF